MYIAVVEQNVDIRGSFDRVVEGRMENLVAGDRRRFLCCMAIHDLGSGGAR